MTKVDHRKEFKQLYNASARKPTILDVPPLNFLMIDGAGKPDRQEFQNAASTIYPVAYSLKFMVREQQGIDYRVMPMEVRWFVNREKKQFKWTMMLMQPEMVTDELYAKALEQVSAKGMPPSLAKLRFESYHEGLCVQILHKGPYPKMDDTFEEMMAFIKAQGYISEPKPHDIYLNSILRTKPENLKTIIRSSIEPISQN
jgi:hypothetical protein